MMRPLVLIVDDEPDLLKKLRAAQYLMEKFDEKGVLIRPHSESAPDYSGDIDFDLEDS